MTYFEEAGHIYYNQDGILYHSPSKIFPNYKNKFDAKTVARNYARKHGYTAKYWLAKWDETRDTALTRGTGIHNEREELDLGRGVTRSVRGLKPVLNPELHYSDTLIDLPDGVYPEITLWNDGWRISGRADRVTITTLPSGDRIADIDDYKTNRRIDKKSRVDFYTNKHMMMKPPLRHIMDSSYWHYALQLSMYMYMLETHGFKPGKIQIIHIPHPFPGVMGEMIQPPDEYIELPYLKAEIIAVLKDYDKKRKTEYVNKKQS